MPALGKNDQAKLLMRVLECSAQTVGWQQVLDFIDDKLDCRSFLAEFDQNSRPLPHFGGLQSAIEIGAVMRRIQTEGGRNALQFLLSEASLFYPYCKTTLAGGRANGEPVGERAADQPPIDPGLNGAELVLQASPGLISPIWRGETSTILFGCLFLTHTPATIDAELASVSFRNVARALSPGLNIHFQAQREKMQNQINQAFLSASEGPAVLIDCERRILAQTCGGTEVLAELEAAFVRRETLIFKNKQMEACLTDLQAAFRLSRDLEASRDTQPENVSQGPETRSVFVAMPDGFLKRISINAVCPPQLPISPEPPWFLIRVRETADVSEAVEQCLQTYYDLSQSEAHLARQLTDSGSMNATIECLGITRNTAKTHLRRIYDKTGAHTQLQLARLVHRLAKLF
jgi:DNA-binding CsgD family transcriptional regulator